MSARLTEAQCGALLGRAPFALSGDKDGPDGEQWWIWAGEGDRGRRTLDSLVRRGLAVADGREDGYLTYRLTESGRAARRQVAS